MPVLPFETRRTRALTAPRASGAVQSGRTPVSANSPERPKLHVNLSPAFATRTLAATGLGITFAATVGTAIDLAWNGTPTGTIHAWVGLDAAGSLSAWLLSVPWLFLGAVIFAISRVERQVSRPAWRRWALLAALAVSIGALTAGGGALAAAFSPFARAALMALPATAAVAWLGPGADHGRGPRLQIVGGLLGGVATAARPFQLLSTALLPGQPPGVTLHALLVVCDSLAGLVCATLAVQAALVFVRDLLPDFAIALRMSGRVAVPTARTARHG
jgi:hypothetical protein